MAGWSLSIFCSLIFIRSTLLTDIEMWQWDFASQGFSQCHKTFVLRVTWLAKSLSYLELQCYRVARRRGLRTENSATHIVLSTCQKYVVDFCYGSRHRFHYWAPAKRPIRNFLTFVFFLFSLLATSHQAPMKHSSAHKLRNC